MPYVFLQSIACLACQATVPVLSKLTLSPAENRSGLFALFTVALLATHTILIAANMPTLEEIGAQRMRAREKRVPARLPADLPIISRADGLAHYVGARVGAMSRSRELIVPRLRSR